MQLLLPGLQCICVAMADMPSLPAPWLEERIHQTTSDYAESFGGNQGPGHTLETRADDVRISVWIVVIMHVKRVSFLIPTQNLTCCV